MVQPCPECRTVLERTEGQAQPEPGDWAVCAGCAARLVFGEDRQLRRPRPGEWTALLYEDPALGNLLVRMGRQVLAEKRRRAVGYVRANSLRG